MTTIQANEKDLDLVRACAPVADLAAAARAKVVEAVSIAIVPGSQDIITQGTVGDAFYILLDGTVEVWKNENGKDIKLTELQAGSYFGEQALLGKKDGLRSATVRAKGDCRVGSVTADVFAQLIAASGQNRDRFESDASTYVYREITKSLNSFIATELDETAEGVERRTVAKGTTLVQEGDASDSAFLILSGVAAVYKNIKGESREVARMGGGQIFGELGVLKGEARAATVVADSDMELLQIFGDAFVRWHKAHPDAAGFFNSLSNVYRLSQGRQMSVFLGEVGGAKAVTSVVGRPTDGVVSTRVLDQGVVVFTNAGAGAVEGERATMKYADDKIKRELRVVVKARKGDKIERCLVYAVQAEGIENDLGTLYQHVLNLDEVQAVALRRFERTGFLGGTADKSDRLCPCLGLGPTELTAAVQEMGADFATLQANVGVGGICGGCERPVREFLEHSDATRSEASADAHESETPAIRIADVPPNLLTPDEKQLAALIARGMGAERTSVTREQLAVRLRATGVRDMNFFIDMLFPGVFTQYARATYATLAAALGRGLGFGQWRQQALQPNSKSKDLFLWLAQALNRLGRSGVVAGLLLIAVVSVALSPEYLLPFWSVFLGLVVLGYAGLSLRPSGRFLRTMIIGGPSRFYRALWAAYGQEKGVATLKLTPFGKPVYFVREERLVDYILQNPDVYARSPLTGYPPFAEHSVLGGGSSGVWLGYRMLCEEYFAERYREDLDQMREIVRERLEMWAGRDSIDLLKEVYRIVVEIHARLFFQTSFDSFDDDATVDYPKIIDRVLHAATLLFADPCDGEIDELRSRVLSAVRGSTRKDSIGGILLEAWQAGDINEREACENAVMYMLAQAPTMGIFWTLYRSAHVDSQSALRGSRKEIVKAIKEELRLHAPVASMFSRSILRNDTLGKFPVVAGGTIILCPMYIHTNADQWRSPYEYDPNRWTSAVGDGKEIVDPKTDPADANSRPGQASEAEGAARYLPFGGGGQACQGRWFAADEMLIVVEEVLKNYDLKILDDRGLLGKPLPEQVKFHVYNRPFNDVRMKPVRRRTES